VSSFTGDGVNVDAIRSSARSEIFFAPNFHPGQGGADFAALTGLPPVEVEGDEYFHAISGSRFIGVVQVFVSSFTGDGVNVDAIRSSARSEIFFAPNFHPGQLIILVAICNSERLLTSRSPVISITVPTHPVQSTSMQVIQRSSWSMRKSLCHRSPATGLMSMQSDPLLTS
jgi:hypothetical protein